MEICEEVVVHRSGPSEANMVASDSFQSGGIVPNSTPETLQNRFTLYNVDNENNNNLLQTVTETNSVYDSDIGCGKVFNPRNERKNGVSLKMGVREFSTVQIPEGSSRQDTYSIASSCSSASSSSSLSSMGITFETERRMSNACQDVQPPIKVFGPADDSQNSSGNESQSHPRIRRVPSTANPKYRVPSLQRNQRSMSQPYIQVNQLTNTRRNSSPSKLNQGNVPTVHSRTVRQIASTPDFHNVNQQQQYLQQQQEQNQQQKEQQQQIIYLQIPQPSQTQLGDPQGLQQQISSQLQLLVPQIYSQLVNQINAPSPPLNTVKVSLDQSTSDSKDPNVDSSSYLSSNFTMNGNQSQRVMNQMLTQNNMKQYSNQKAPSQPSKRQRPQRQSSNIQKAPSLESLSETESQSRQLTANELSQILQHIPAQVLQQNYSKSHPTFIEVQHQPGYPKISIPVTPELLLHCQQLQQLKEPGFVPYQPRLETILEESLSVKRLNMSRFSKTKVVACLLTILCVIVVILLAGDSVVAVAVIAAVFILFLLASTYYLYSHSTRNELEDAISTSDESRIQVSTISKCDKNPSYA